MTCNSTLLLLCYGSPQRRGWCFWTSSIENPGCWLPAPNCPSHAFIFLWIPGSWIGKTKKKKTFMSTLRAKGWVSLFRKSAFSLYFLCFFSTSWSLQEASKTAFHWTCLTKMFVFFFLWGKRKVNLLKNEWTVFGKRMQNYFTESLNTFKVYHYLNYLGT